MEIHDFPPPKSDDNILSDQSYHAIIQTSRSCDKVIKAISSLQVGIANSTNDVKYHKFVTGVIQTFSALEVNMQKLATENPAFTATLVSVKQIYQQLVQPIVVSTYSDLPSPSESEKIVASLNQAKESLEEIIGHLSDP